MALRYNSKKARENIRAYIMKYIGIDALVGERGYTGDTTSFDEVARFVYKKFREQKDFDYFYRNWPERRVFEDWATGLPFNDMFCYYYNRSAVRDLALVLEETEEEIDEQVKRSRRKDPDDEDGERAAEKMLTNLIYDEIIKAVERGE